MGRTGKALLRWMFRTADHCVVLGDVWRRWVIDTFGVRPSRISVDLQRRAGHRDETVPRAGRATGVFACCSSATCWSARASRTCCARLPARRFRARDIDLTMAGGGPVETYRAMAAELGIADRVTFTGWVSQDDARALMVHLTH